MRQSCCPFSFGLFTWIFVSSSLRVELHILYFGPKIPFSRGFVDLVVLLCFATMDFCECYYCFPFPIPIYNIWFLIQFTQFARSMADFDSIYRMYFTVKSICICQIYGMKLKIKLNSKYYESANIRTNWQSNNRQKCLEWDKLCKQHHQ